MSETSIVLGEIRVTGMAHGAVNAMVINFADREDWEFKQFLSQEQMDDFAAANSYQIVYPPEKSEWNNRTASQPATSTMHL